MSQEALPKPPEPVRRRRSRGPALHSGSVELRTVTPILGGAPETRKVDQVDFIRAPTVRGHLRFWWRALYTADCQDVRQLQERERELWGGMGAGGDEPVRSQVELRVHPLEWPDKPDTSPIAMRDVSAYALWPARGEAGGTAAERWPPGLRFRLEWRVPERLEDNRAAAEEVEAAIRAWILFGGHGSRTRRGCGSLTVEKEAARWLPTAATAAAIEKLFTSAQLRFDQPRGPLRQTPSLHGARLYSRAAQAAEQAWLEALGWLRDFRQKPAAPGAASKDFARLCSEKPGAKIKRPGRSNWPEPDKIRQLLGRYPSEHAPRYNAQPAWPRAGFGLPIQMRFQQQSRQGPPYSPPEPGGKDGFMLVWAESGSAEHHDRLASPLITKALPLADGRFAPVALWLYRAPPENGQVILLDQKSKRHVPRSQAPFHRLLGEGDTPLYEPLRGEQDLRSAFFKWLGRLPPPQSRPQGGRK